MSPTEIYSEVDILCEDLKSKRRSWILTGEGRRALQQLKRWQCRPHSPSRKTAVPCNMNPFTLSYNIVNSGKSLILTLSQLVNGIGGCCAGS